MTVGRGRARAGIREVAAAAGVSDSTVSNVINNPQIVSARTRQRVEAAMEQTGFVRNRAASQLRGAPSSVVGCVVLDSANTFFAEVARGIEDRLAEAGCMQTVCSTDLHVSREHVYLQMLEEQGVRGIIVDPVNPELDELVALSRRGTPVVLLDRPRGAADLCGATVDHIRGGQLATEHLLSLGHRRIVLLRGAITVSTISDRGEGARRACLEMGLDPADTLVGLRLSPLAVIDGADAAVDHILAIRPTPTAILCCNDSTAVGVLRGLRRSGVRVPDEMSVVGYDDVSFASELSPALTTVRQPTYALGRAAAELLLAEDEPAHAHEELVFAPKLIVRDSTAHA